jgi:ABC-2 type transport system permease protein
VVKADKDQRLVGVLQQVLATRSLALELRRAGLSEGQVEDALAVPAARVEQVDTGDESRRASAAILSIVLYLLLFMLMVAVANGTAIEKSNRISEVLLAVVPPRSLLFGKVLGVGAAGLLTTLAGALPVIVKSAAGGDLPDGLGSALAGGAAWFLLGLVLYLTVAGALGALVERQEQAATAVAPLQVLLVAGYLVAQSASDTPVGTVLAYLPLTSPLVMPSRLAVGGSSPAEMAISLALGVLAVALSLRLGASVYRRAIVRTGRRLKLREVLVSR